MRTVLLYCIPERAMAVSHKIQHLPDTLAETASSQAESSVQPLRVPGRAGPEQSSGIRDRRVWVLDVVRGDVSKRKAIILNLWQML